MCQNDKGFVYGITYVSHKRGAVINASELGKEYSAKTILDILEKCRLNQNLAQLQKMSSNIYSADNTDKNLNEEKQSLEANRSDTPELLKELERGVERTVKELVNAMPMDDYIPPMN